MPGIRVRPARRDEREELLAMKRRNWPAVILANERRRWEWEFDENPAHDPRRPEAVVAEVDGTPAGMLTLIPHRVQIGADTRRAANAADFCVDAPYRGRGVATELCRRWMDAATCDFAYATGPTAESGHVMVKCGGTLLPPAHGVAAWAWFVDGEHAAAPDAPLPAARLVEEVAQFDAEWDRAWERIRKHHELLLVRDAAYLNWRYRDFPFAKPVLLACRAPDGAVAGAAVVQRDARHDRLYLLEALAEPSDQATLRALLVRAIDVARVSGSKILYHATRDARQVALLRALGFAPVPGDVPKFLGKVNHVPAGGAVSVEDWTVSLGDGDQLYNVGEPDGR